MRNSFCYLAITSFFILSSQAWAEAEKNTDKPPFKIEHSVKYDQFTGKILKNRVRMRLQANFESPVLKELQRNDLVVVVGESEDFYAVQPPSDILGYVFRTFVLDNVVEGNHVNLRIKPDTDSPVISQLDAGTRVEGKIARENNKWLEIKLPQTTRFYVAKEFVEKAGDAGFKDRFEKKKADLYHLLSVTDTLSRTEMQKPFDLMMVDGLKSNYEHIILDFPEFPEASQKAKESLAALQDDYTKKKVAFLEKQAGAASSTQETNLKLSAELQAHKSKINDLESEIEKGRQFVSLNQTAAKPAQMPVNMSTWLPIEENLFNQWLQKNPRSDPKHFYEEQSQQGFVLRGVVDHYNRPVKNKPGDFMILNTASRMPVAFLYSTHINLQDYVGHEVSILVSPRDNHHFAFPAYFVLTVQ